MQDAECKMQNNNPSVTFGDSSLLRRRQRQPLTPMAFVGRFGMGTVREIKDFDSTPKGAFDRRKAAETKLKRSETA